MNLHPGEDSDKFKASLRWLWRFFCRHGIRQLSLQGKKLSADAADPEPFRKILEEYMEVEGLTLDQVYNCDETGRYFSFQERPWLLHLKSQFQA